MNMSSAAGRLGMFGPCRVLGVEEQASSASPKTLAIELGPEGFTANTICPAHSVGGRRIEGSHRGRRPPCRDARRKTSPSTTAGRA